MKCHNQEQIDNKCTREYFELILSWLQFFNWIYDQPIYTLFFTWVLFLASDYGHKLILSSFFLVFDTGLISILTWHQFNINDDIMPFKSIQISRDPSCWNWGF